MDYEKPLKEESGPEVKYILGLVLLAVGVVIAAWVVIKAINILVDPGDEKLTVFMLEGDDSAVDINYGEHHFKISGAGIRILALEWR